MNIAKRVIAFGLIGTSSIVGCASEPTDDADGAAAAVTPKQAENTFEQVKVCDNLFKDRAAFRDVDLQQGVLRWKCGDVDAVTISACEDDLGAIARREESANTDGAREASLVECSDGYGQEYCESNAVANGSVVNSVKSGRELRDSDVVECVFTAVFSDVEDEATPAYHKELASKLKPQLTSPKRDLEGRVAGMKQSANSRAAADALINDCSNLGNSPDEALHKNAERQVLCYKAWTAAGNATARRRIEEKCASADLADDSEWAKTGLADAELSDAEKDLAACTMVLYAPNGGIAWRNSDPTICARSYRATHECNVGFKQIGEVAPGLQGFAMMGWTNRDTLPPACKYAQIDGAPYKQLVVCKPNAADVKAYRTQRKPLQQLCRDKFGVNVSMQAPVGALADLGNAKTDTPFCSAFVGGARAARGGR
jgi:hypothetical protein